MLQLSCLGTYIAIQDGVQDGRRKNGKSELCVLSLMCHTDRGKLDYFVTISYKHISQSSFDSIGGTFYMKFQNGGQDGRQNYRFFCFTLLAEHVYRRIIHVLLT